jgi:Flagellar hook-length control protein FliK
MSISVNPTIPVIAAQSLAPDLVLQPGSVVDAQVLKLLSDNLVRIAIAGLSIDVLTEVPLAAGQNLQLAVSKTESGVRLAVIQQGPGAAASTTADAVTLAPNAPVDSPAPPAVALSLNALTRLERLAVAAAAQSAATQQASLAPLFANLDAAAASNNLPPKLQQAVVQVLAQQTNLDPGLTGSDIKNAFQKSGLFLEAGLASGSALPAAGVPDLKAALIVLRQTLLSSLGTAGVESPSVPATVVQQILPPIAGNAPAADTAPPLQSDTASPPHAATTATTLAADIEGHQILPPQARLPLAGYPLEQNGTLQIALPETLLKAGPRTMTTGAALNLLQEARQESSELFGKMVVPKGEQSSEDVSFRTNTPPPPFRGALPSAQPVAAPSIASGMPLATTVHHLLGDADAAIARQTLLQVASLPDRVEASGGRIDQAMPRWSFEIPFVTPQGTAMAQFEISRDGGGGSDVDAAERVWRARFSLDVEPAGPVHALVSLTGERTSVRLWAERPATAAQLRAGAAQLGEALGRAELQPGDIVIRNGAPPQPPPARAGHFLDRAL